MRKPLKILFDENYGPPLVRALETVLTQYREKTGDVLEPGTLFIPQRPVVKSILDFYKQGMLDEQWIPLIASEGWIVISTDRAKRCGGGKFPALCAKHNVTHVLVSGKLHEAGQFEKARALFVVWEELVALCDAMPGSRYSMRYNQVRRPVLVPAASGRAAQREVEVSKGATP